MINLNGLNNWESILIYNQYSYEDTSKKNHQSEYIEFFEYTIKGEKNFFVREISTRILSPLLTVINLVQTVVIHSFNIIRYLALAIVGLDYRFAIQAFKSLIGLATEIILLPILGVVAIVHPKSSIKLSYSIRNFCSYENLPLHQLSCSQLAVHHFFNAITFPISGVLLSIRMFTVSICNLDLKLLCMAIIVIAISIFAPIGYPLMTKFLPLHPDCIDIKYKMNDQHYSPKELLNLDFNQ